MIETKRVAAGGLLLALLLAGQALAAPLVIAHRGASGYLPEHSLAAKAMAYAMGADYIEQDVVLTRDGVPVVFHDLYLDATTDVAERFDGRARADGRHYVVDFDYAEIRSLSMHERVDLKRGGARFAKRFPPDSKIFRIHSLADELAMLRGLDRANGGKVGIYVELKDPAWHADHGLDLATAVIGVLDEFGYREASDKAYIQSFDATALRRIAEQKLSRLRLIQLIGENRWWPDSKTDHDYLRTPGGLAEIAGYAAGIGPWHRQILTGKNADGAPQFSDLVEQAQAAGLAVHAYTVRADALPGFVDDLGQWLDYLLRDQKVDGVFTDQPDRVLDYLHKRQP